MHRSRAGAGTPCGARRRARDARTGASAARADSRRADARALPLGPASRRARGVPEHASRTRRRARDRARPGPPRTRARHPDSGVRTRLRPVSNASGGSGEMPFSLKVCRREVPSDGNGQPPLHGHRGIHACAPDSRRDRRTRRGACELSSLASSRRSGDRGTSSSKVRQELARRRCGGTRSARRKRTVIGFSRAPRAKPRRTSPFPGCAISSMQRTRMSRTRSRRRSGARSTLRSCVQSPDRGRPIRAPWRQRFSPRSGSLAEDSPVLVAVDDVQWLDGSTAFLIGFIARRLQDERIALLVALRSGSRDVESPLGVREQLRIDAQSAQHRSASPHPPNAAGHCAESADARTLARARWRQSVLRARNCARPSAPGRSCAGGGASPARATAGSRRRAARRAPRSEPSRRFRSWLRSRNRP